MYKDICFMEQNKKKCQNCKKIIENNYGSGRFCCQKCARSFSTKLAKNLTKLSNCIKCGKQITIKNNSSKQYCKQCKKTKFVIIGVCKNCGKRFQILSSRNRKRSCCSEHCSQSMSGNASWNQNHRQNMMKIFKQSFESGDRPCRGGKTKRYKYKDIVVQGTYQLRTCEILDTMLIHNDIKKWDYTNDKIKYKWEDGTDHLYFPDFKITNNDNTWYYLQIKGFKKRIDELKWQQTKNQGFALIVWYQKDIVRFQKLYNIIK